MKKIILNLSIQKKIFYPTAALLIIIITFFSTFIIVYFKNIFEEEINTKAHTLLKTMSMLITSYSSFDGAFLTEDQKNNLSIGIKESQNIDKKISFVSIYGRNHKLSILRTINQENININIENKYKNLSIKMSHNPHPFSIKEHDKIIAAIPLNYNKIFQGTMLLGISTKELNNRLKIFTAYTISGSILILIIFIFITRMIASTISSPIRLIAKSAILLENQKFKEGIQKISSIEYGKNEIGILGNEFIKMGNTLESVLNKLEDKIELANQDLKEAHDDLKQKHSLIKEKQDIMEKELQIAKKVQQKLLPKAPEKAPFQLSAKMHVASSIGGDLYHFKYNNDNKLSIAIGDVSGHGIPAALIMVLIRDAFLNYSDHVKPPHKVLFEMNEKICKDVEPGLFTTFFYAEIDFKKLSLSYCNGGHNLPILVQGNKFYQLDSSGLILGVSCNSSYKSKEIKIRKGDILFLYTDGLTELCKKDTSLKFDNMLGIEPILKIIYKLKDKSTEEIIDKINDLIKKHSGNPPYEDDVTFLCLKI